VVYKKLLGLKPTLDDFALVDPAMARGLRAMLTMNEDVKTSLDLTFTVEEDRFGETITIPLKPNGEDIAVTNANRSEYVDLFVQYALTKSIANKYDAFRAGFFNVCEMKKIRMFRPEELELLIRGSCDLDFKALEDGTQYEGFATNSPTIKFFWEIVHDMKEEDKKKFLEFCTGSDRVPIAGLSTIKFTISKNGSDQSKLPTSHTCFNHLLLPAYTTREQCQRMLMLAIQNSKGFGLR